MIKNDFYRLLNFNNLPLDFTSYIGYALSYSDSTVFISNQSSSLSNRLVGDPSTLPSSEIPAIKLEDIPLLSDTDYPIILVIDCEGSEIDLFLNSKASLLSRFLVVLVEINLENCFNDVFYSFSDVVDLITRRGFTLSYSDGNCAAFLNSSFL